jgi:ribosomal protein S18 acetylase RimI-like enzyme
MAAQIRPLEPGEYEEGGRVTALAYETFAPDEASQNRDYLDRVDDVAGRARDALVLGAFQDGRLVGTVTLELERRIPGGLPRAPLEPDQAHVRMLGVHPDVMRRGIGRALMKACLQEARRAGKRRVTLETTERMVAAQRLYQAMGFRRGPDHVFDDGFRLLTFELPLTETPD